MCVCISFKSNNKPHFYPSFLQEVHGNMHVPLHARHLSSQQPCQVGERERGHPVSLQIINNLIYTGFSGCQLTRKTSQACYYVFNSSLIKWWGFLRHIVSKAQELGSGGGVFPPSGEGKLNCFGISKINKGMFHSEYYFLYTCHIFWASHCNRPKKVLSEFPFCRLFPAPSLCIGKAVVRFQRCPSNLHMRFLIQECYMHGIKLAYICRSLWLDQSICASAVSPTVYI